LADGVRQRVSADADFLPGVHPRVSADQDFQPEDHPRAVSVAPVPEAANEAVLPAIRHLEEDLLASRPQCALTIDRTLVRFSEQYFFFVFLADSCVARYPLQLRNIDAVEYHGQLTGPQLHRALAFSHPWQLEHSRF
jgi:hypothetical protein